MVSSGKCLESDGGEDGRGDDWEGGEDGDGEWEGMDV